MRGINVLLICSSVLNLCNGMIMTKFGRVGFYYKLNAAKVKTGPASDRSEKFSSQRLRAQLCDEVINAKQFQGRYHERHYVKMKNNPQVDLRAWGSASGSNLNYQKSQNSAEPQKLLVRMHDRYEWMYPIHCVNTPNIQWFVTSLPGEDYLYLLEPTLMEKQAQKGLRMTGLFEPSASMDFPGFDYFFRQFRSKKNEMTSSVCDLGMDGRLRVCAAVLDALNKKGIHELDQLNYIRHDQRCVQRFVKSEDKYLANTYALPCTHADELYPTKAALRKTSLVFLLADANKRGAVFVLIGDKIGGLIVYGRVSNVKALTNPIPKGGNSKPKNRNNARNSVTREDSKLAASKQRTSRKRDRSRNSPKYNTDAETTTDEEPECKSETTTDGEDEYEDEKITTEEEVETRLSRYGRNSNSARSRYVGVTRPAPTVLRRRVNPTRAGRLKNLAFDNSDTEIPREKTGGYEADAATTEEEVTSRRPPKYNGNPRRRRLILYDDDDDDDMF